MGVYDAQTLTLPNSYIHGGLSDRAVAILGRLSKKQIMQLVDKWLDDSSTRPPLTLEDSDEESGQENRRSEEEDERRVVEWVRRELPQARRFTRPELIQALRFDYWSNGFNLLQVAQIESKCMWRLNGSI